MLRGLLLAGLCGLVSACGDLARDNPVDPAVNGGLTLGEQLLGAWSRADDEANEIYTFSADGRVELRRFSSPTGGQIDRNAPWPETRQRLFAGTYKLVGSLLEIFFTQAQSNDPDDVVQIPSTRKVVPVGIRRGTLTLEESDGTRFYTQLQ